MQSNAGSETPRTLKNSVLENVMTVVSQVMGILLKIRDVKVIRHLSPTIGSGCLTFSPADMSKYIFAEDKQ